MKTSLFSTAVIFLFLGGIKSARASYFQDVLVCDGGAATVQVDIAERRSFQLVVANKEIKYYFLKAITTPREEGLIAWPQYQGSVAPFFPGSTYPSPAFELEMTVNGWAKEGLFRSSDFTGFQMGDRIDQPGVKECGPYSGNGCAGSLESYYPTVFVKRDSGGLKVEFWRPRNVGRYCTQTDGYSLQCTQYTPPSGWEALPLANWYFRSCEQKEILP